MKHEGKELSTPDYWALTFVRYKEGAEMYSMCQSKFEDMAKDAGAIYPQSGIS